MGYSFWNVFLFSPDLTIKTGSALFSVSGIHCATVICEHCMDSNSMYTEVVIITPHFDIHLSEELLTPFMTRDRRRLHVGSFIVVVLSSVEYITVTILVMPETGP